MLRLLECIGNQKWNQFQPENPQKITLGVGNIHLEENGAAVQS